MGYASVGSRFDVESKSGVLKLENLRFFFSAEGGDEFSQNSLSYGEKRLLSFFAISDASEDVLIIDELVNGLHHEWIAVCLEEIGERQAFLTSQNPLLLDHLEFSSAQDVQEALILCERSRDPDGSKLIWRNPTDAEANEFFEAYETGIQRVSDILINKGLW
jgi:AAA domain, putative AbiEii toxin, Type IV TA system